MREVQDMLYDKLNDDTDLRVLLGAVGRIKVSHQPERTAKPCVTISQRAINKKIPDVKEIWTIEYLVVAWNAKTDKECEEIGNRVRLVLDEGIVSNSEALVQGCDLNEGAGPYWFEAAQSWRKDLILEIIAQRR